MTRKNLLLAVASLVFMAGVLAALWVPTKVCIGTSVVGVPSITDCSDGPLIGGPNPYRVSGPTAVATLTVDKRIPLRFAIAGGGLIVGLLIGAAAMPPSAPRKPEAPSRQDA